jgi:hypothetical protein
MTARSLAVSLTKALIHRATHLATYILAGYRELLYFNVQA